MSLHFRRLTRLNGRNAPDEDEMGIVIIITILLLLPDNMRYRGKTKLLLKTMSMPDSSVSSLIQAG